MSDVWSFSLLIDSFSFSSIYWLVVVVLCSFLFTSFFGIVWHFNWTSIELWWWRWWCYRLYNRTSSFLFLHSPYLNTLALRMNKRTWSAYGRVFNLTTAKKKKKKKKKEEEGEKYTSDSPKGPRREQSPSKFLLFSFFSSLSNVVSSVIMTSQFISTSCHLLLDQTNNKHHNNNDQLSEQSILHLYMN